MEKANNALYAIPTPADREHWLAVTMAYKAAGGGFEIWDDWCKRGDNYNESNNRHTWNSIKPTGGITEASLYRFAIENGWTDQNKDFVLKKMSGKNTGFSSEADTGVSVKQVAYALHVTKDGSAADETEASSHLLHDLSEKSSESVSAEGAIASFIAKSAPFRTEAEKYFSGRGISAETVDKFSVGFDAETRSVVIPYPGDTYYITRSIDTGPNSSGRRYTYPPGAGKRLFNKPALLSEEIVFIVEGQIDAMSLCQAGAFAVASNEPKQILEAIRENECNVPVFVIIPDSDKTGAVKAQKMGSALSSAGYNTVAASLPKDYKDVNDFLSRAGQNTFSEWVDRTKIAAAAHLKKLDEANRESYIVISAGNRLDGFVNGIAQSVNTVAVPSGYPTLDLELDGGLYEGLYIIGAISSLGKTTFALQMVDQIAETGKDCIVFSLEMAANELIAKSISRLTTCTASRHSDRKTTRGITSGARYERYSQQEKETINRAIEKYAGFAERLFIHEGIGDIGVTQIRNAVKRHRDVTGNVPVILIDYLQIIAPTDMRATDKQNTDKAVLELKRISRDFKTPVIAVSSFNRENYSVQATMAAFKESGAVEYSADVLMALQLKGVGAKEFDVSKEKNKDPREIELVVLKNRNGRSGGVIPMEYYPMFNLFKDIKNGHRYTSEDVPHKAKGKLSDWYDVKGKGRR